MPNKEYNVLGLKFNLNPCPFNMKEHTIIVSTTLVRRRTVNYVSNGEFATY